MNTHLAPHPHQKCVNTKRKFTHLQLGKHTVAAVDMLVDILAVEGMAVAGVGSRAVVDTEVDNLIHHMLKYLYGTCTCIFVTLGQAVTCSNNIKVDCITSLVMVISLRGLWWCTL